MTHQDITVENIVSWLKSLPENELVAPEPTSSKNCLVANFCRANNIHFHEVFFIEMATGNGIFQLPYSVVQLIGIQLRTDGECTAKEMLALIERMKPLEV